MKSSMSFMWEIIGSFHKLPGKLINYYNKSWSRKWGV